jgi:hypothetical protein
MRAAGQRLASALRLQAQHIAEARFFAAEAAPAAAVASSDIGYVAQVRSEKSRRGGQLMRL